MKPKYVMLLLTIVVVILNCLAAVIIFIEKMRIDIWPVMAVDLCLVFLLITHRAFEDDAI